MLVHRLRCWPNIEPALGEPVVLAGYIHHNYVILDISRHFLNLCPSRFDLTLKPLRATIVVFNLFN